MKALMIYDSVLGNEWLEIYNEGGITDAKHTRIKTCGTY